jgi:hypothetical protein
VTSIGWYAFQNCSGFTGTLTIPDSVTRIYYDAFWGCSGFNIINVSTWTNIPTIDTDAFANFQAVGTVYAPSGLGITLSTFDGLPSTWNLQEV